MKIEALCRENKSFDGLSLESIYDLRGEKAAALAKISDSTPADSSEWQEASMFIRGSMVEHGGRWKDGKWHKRQDSQFIDLAGLAWALRCGWIFVGSDVRMRY